MLHREILFPGAKLFPGYAVDDEGNPDEQGERGEADVRIGDDHDAGEQLHSSGEDVPATVLVDVEGGDDANYAHRNQLHPDQQRDRRDPLNRVADQENPDDRGEHPEQRDPIRGSGCRP